MEKIFKIFLCVAVVGLFIGIFIAKNAPKPAMTIYEESYLRGTINELNADLPRTVGTIATMDSIVYRNRTITYNMTVFGDNLIKEVYKQNYNKFRDVFKYAVLVNNGQHNMGDVLISILKEKGISLAYRVYTQDGDNSEWSVSTEELEEFAENYRVSPTAALGKIIDIHIEVANVYLPVKIEDINDPIKSVILNAFLGDIDEDFLPQSVSYIDDTIVFEYDVNDSVIDIDELDDVKDDRDFIETFASLFAEDADANEFLGIIAISHSNLVITCNGRKSHKSVSIFLPYEILKKYCSIPQDLLS